TFGFPEYDRDELVEAARIQAGRGVNALKMVVGVHKDGWREDAERVRRVRDTIGPDVDLAIDANYMFSPLDAKYLVRELEDVNLAWFEEPIHCNDFHALKDLRRSTNVPIAAGQQLGTIWEFRDLLQAQ